MPEFVDIPITTDTEVLQDSAIDYIAEQVDGWEPNPANLEVWMIEAIARMASEVAVVAADVPSAIFRSFGPLISVTPIEATPAIAATTWTALDTLGHTIDGGTYLTIADVGFEVVDTVVIPAGSTSTAVGEVQVIALEDGSQNNGLVGPVLAVDPLEWLQGITVVGQTSGGEDAEADEDFQNRLVGELQMMAPRPITPHDYELFVQRIPEVARALALDGYNPATQTYNNERMITVVAVDAAGAGVTVAVQNEIKALLESYREVNFIVNVTGPTPNNVTVNFTVTVYEDWDANTVVQSAEDAVAQYLNPATWGIPPFRDDSSVWVNQPKVRYLEVAQVINNTPGVNTVESLTINGASADFNMTGVAPMPNATAITGAYT